MGTPRSAVCALPGEIDLFVSGNPTRGQVEHLEGCPSCRTLLAEYRCFLEGRPPAGADPADAARKLGPVLLNGS